MSSLLSVLAPIKGSSLVASTVTVGNVGVLRSSLIGLDTIDIKSSGLPHKTFNKIIVILA